MHVTNHSEIDLAVIGSGGAAMAAGIAARRAGASVVLVERGVLGGTCVNVGCVPSKALLAAAGSRSAALSNPFAGVPTDAGRVDMRALTRQKSELTAWLRQHKYAEVADAWGFPVLTGEARFEPDGSLDVAGRRLEARHYVIATGAEPHVEGVDGIDGVDYLTSTTAMELTEVPRSLVVIGGGYVGMEQAQLFAHLGATVTLVGRLAPRAEPELRAVMDRVFTDDGITVHSERATRMQASGGAVAVTTDSGLRIVAERVLVATGRRAVTTALGLEKVGVQTDERGFIVIDDHQRTTNPRIYAAGDVAGTRQFVYVAAAAGRVAAVNALDPDRLETVDYTGLPSVVFTRPQIASAGLTERQAMALGHGCRCRTLDLADVPRALVNHDTRGAVKIVADADSGAVLGVHAVADGAGEMMLAATYAIKAHMTVDDLADTWSPYLTMAESLRIAARLFSDEIVTSCCA
jgi:mercuric reductase